MTEEEKRAKALSIMAEMQSQSRAASLYAATQTALNHTLEVQKAYAAMEKQGFTVDDLINAYNSGVQQSFDFATTFFFAAYAIALNEMGRNVMEALNAAPVPEDTHSFPISSEQIDELKRRGISKKDLLRMERLGAANTKKEMGTDALLKALSKVESEDMIQRVAEIMDEEIVASDILDRCKRETGIDIAAMLGV